jgi:FtsJ-like methyltransferase
LDLGSAPGGFSKFVIENNLNVRGLGITLPSLVVLMDGTPLADLTRYRFEHRDLTMLNFNTQTFQPPSTCVDLLKDGYDLIIAGTFPTGQTISAPARVILALSQLHVILSNLRPRATCVLIANTMLFLWNVEMFAVLRRVFGHIQPAKHRELHAIKCSCYFVCMGFMATTSINNEQRQLLKRKVRCTLEVLKTVEITGGEGPGNKVRFSQVMGRVES